MDAPRLHLKAAGGKAELRTLKQLNDLHLKVDDTARDHRARQSKGAEGGEGERWLNVRLC